MQFENYLKEINKAYQRGDATEHTHRPALKTLIEASGKGVTATNEPKRIQCGAPDYIVSRRSKGGLEQTIGYIEAKDIGKNLSQIAKEEQVKKRYLPSLNNFILTDYIEFQWYLNGEKKLAARLAEESIGKFKVTADGEEKLGQLLEAFLGQQPERIKIARELAEKMAHKAQMMRDIIKETFRQEVETGMLHGQFEAFRDVLLHDLTEEQFADMYAQTICYGLFSARCHIQDMTIFGNDPYAAFHGMDDKARELTREHAAYLLPKTNPFFRDIFGDIAGPKLDDRIVWIVDDLVELLRQADMGVILQDFARQKKRKDPVVHFYETFLAEYDPKLKKSRGVYYTPDEVVSYIVRSVDFLLQTRFGLKRGLADDSKIMVPVKRAAKGKKEGEVTEWKEQHRCLILDPAVGTGTFLHEVVEQIHQKFQRQRGAWSGYVKDHLLPRLFGFELMMAPYAVAHMKVGLQLAETGYDFASEERLGIYLTNTLEEAEETSRTLFAQYLSQEAMAANKVKKEMPIMVVTGNPPYAGHSANKSWEMKGEKKVPNFIGRLLKDYYEVDGKPLGEKNPKWLQDDYVKFIRFGQHRIQQTGSGILAFITNHGYLDNPTFRGMRQSLMRTFDEIYILDLHGNSKKKETCPDGSADKNVFDIQQGVSIGIFVKTSNDGNSAKVCHAHLYGMRKNKYEWLMQNGIDTTSWETLVPQKPFYLFTPHDHKLNIEYHKGWCLTDIEQTNSVGIVTARDNLTIQWDDDAVWKTVKQFSDMDEEKARYIFQLGKDARDWKVSLAQADVRESGPNKKYIKKVLYRPFDIRSIYYTAKTRGFVCMPRPEVMYHMLAGANLGFHTCRQIVSETWQHIQVTNKITDDCYVSNKTRERGYLFPLYLYPKAEKGDLFEHGQWPAGKDGRVPNLAAEFVEELAGKVKLEFVTEGAGDLKKTFGPEDVFYYIYGVLHSPEYRRRYAEFLKIDFPRVPLPGGKGLFGKLSRAGGELAGLHLLEAEELEEAKRWPAFDVEGDNVVEGGYPRYEAEAERAGKGRVYINGGQYFEGVRPEVWAFPVGGYQVCEKWLKDRRGRKLGYEDIRHYQKMVVALGETIRVMEEVDGVIEGEGGWPGAFGG